MGHLASVVLHQSRRNIVGNTDVKVLGIETFQDVDVFHRSAFALTGYGETAFARFATREYGWLAQPKLAKRAKAGGARRDRTADLVIANDALSQLSYGPSAAASAKRGGGQWAPFKSAAPSSQGKARRKANQNHENRGLSGDSPGLPLFGWGGTDI